MEGAGAGAGAGAALGREAGGRGAAANSDPNVWIAA